MKRREFISLVGGAATVWPLAARAQQPGRPVIGFIHLRAPDNSNDLVNGFKRGLAENGYVDGQNVTIEFRWGRGRYDGLATMAAELVQRPVNLLVAGTDAAAVAAKAASSTIPIAFSIGTDPVKLGLVASFNRPGGNATGIHLLTTSLEPKRLGLLHDLVPHAKDIAVLLHPTAPNAENQLRDVQEAARAVRLQAHVLWTSSDREIEAAFADIARQRIAALIVSAGPFFDTHRELLVALAAQQRVPAMYQFREYVVAGGLMSYGIDLPDMYRQLGAYASRILKGARPADMPVVQPTKFELVINLKTAKALGLDVPPQMLATADEVIE
jgi:putative ABC transport system substrate-binding protein